MLGRKVLLNEMKKVLIVDDDRYIRELYEELLKSEGYTVETAVDGEDGLNKISAGGYDLILLDVMMPKIDGFGVLVKLDETHPQSPNGPVVILTNLANDPIISQALKKGAVDCFIKSDHTPADLLALVQKYIR